MAMAKAQGFCPRLSAAPLWLSKAAAATIRSGDDVQAPLCHRTAGAAALVNS